MKLACAIAFVFLLNTLHAQQSFQGSIVYKYHLPNLSDAPEMLVIYGSNKIKVKYKHTNTWENNYFLIDLDSGKLFTVDPETKTFFSKQLLDTGTKQTSTTKTIAGYKTNSVKLKHSSSSNIFGLFSSGNAVLFAAADLFYQVPQKYKGIPELMMIQNDHIVLGAEQTTESPIMDEEIPDSLVKQTLISIQAIKIDSQAVGIAEFLIPSNFKKLTWRDVKDSDTTVVETVISVESEEIPPPPPPPVKKKTGSDSNSPKKTKPIKTEGIKPKNSY
jgi:hypothetical protein